MRRERTMIEVNFAATDYRFVARIRTVLFAVILLLGLTTAGMALRTSTHRQQAAAMEQKISELAASQEKLRPVIEERERLVKDLSGMGALVAARSFSWTGFLTAIEEVFPPGVALQQLDFNTQDRSMSLEGIAHSPEALSSLMIGMQRTRMLRNPVLKHQSMEKGILSFNVAVTYQEPPVTGVVEGAVRRPGR